jgi:hypothetical protein
MPEKGNKNYEELLDVLIDYKLSFCNRTEVY